MASIREQIIEAVIGAVSALSAPDLAGHVPVYREDGEAVNRKDLYAIIVDWESETVQALTGRQDEAAMLLDLAAGMRSTRRNDEALDALMVAAHRALMTDRTLGGLCSDIRRRAAGRATQYGDHCTNEVRQRYEIIYRNRANEMEALT